MSKNILSPKILIKWLFSHPFLIITIWSDHILLKNNNICIYLGAMRPASISNEFPSGLTSKISPSSERTLRNPLSSSPIIVALNDDLLGRNTVTSVLLV